jgi:hypothetical protein
VRTRASRGIFPLITLPVLILHGALDKNTRPSGFAKTYLATQRILADSTTISLTDDAEPSRVGEPVTFTAFVAANSTSATGYPSGTVQFAVDGSNVGAPVMIDAKGRATWETSRLKMGTHRVTASYLPGADSVFLPSARVEKIHMVRRCPCADEHEHINMRSGLGVTDRVLECKIRALGPTSAHSPPDALLSLDTGDKQIKKPVGIG